MQQQRICLQYRRPGFDPWVRKIPWGREWLPTPQNSCLENSVDRGAWQATVHAVAEWVTTEQLTHSKRIALRSHMAVTIKA